MRSLEGFMGLMKESADLLVDSVDLHATNGQVMDIHGMIGAMTVQVVGTTAFGYTSILSLSREFIIMIACYSGPGWRGPVQILSTVPTNDWVLLGSGESNKG